MGGIGGAILTGIFALDGGLIYTGSFELLGKQIAGAAAGVAFSALGTALIVVVLRLVMKLRIPEEHERSGIDQHTHGETYHSPVKRSAAKRQEWEWGNSRNYTDWYQASAEFVQDLVRPYADPTLGPVLHVGCGDAPVPEHLHAAGFPSSEHIDIAPEVIARMRDTYPAEQWPGFSFQVRDFLTQGAPPPKGRFCAVLDKALTGAVGGRVPLAPGGVETLVVGVSWVTGARRIRCERSGSYLLVVTVVMWSIWRSLLDCSACSWAPRRSWPATTRTSKQRWSWTGPARSRRRW
eukprot:g14852.t1